MPKSPLDACDDVMEALISSTRDPVSMADLRLAYNDMFDTLQLLAPLVKTVVVQNEQLRKRIRGLEQQLEAMPSGARLRRKNPVKCKECGETFRPLVKPGPVPKFCSQQCRQTFFNNYDEARARRHIRNRRSGAPAPKRLPIDTNLPEYSHD